MGQLLERQARDPEQAQPEQPRAEEEPGPKGPGGRAPGGAPVHPLQDQADRNERQGGEPEKLCVGKREGQREPGQPARKRGDQVTLTSFRCAADL